MPTLLLELGCEELPASACREAEAQLPELAERYLGERPDRLYVGPRRLAIVVEDLPERTPDEWVQGPPVKLREQAAPGFAKRHGVPVEELVERDGFLGVVVPGKPLAEVLPSRVNEIVRGLAFSKSMRWDDSGLRFSRPVRWRCVKLDGATVEGGVSYGHRFTAGELEIEDAAAYAETLRAAGVEPDAEERRRAVLAGLDAIGGWSDPAGVLEEVVYLVESPVVLEGSFDEKFLQLPEDRPEILRETAQEIQADYQPATPYEAARAIERYLIYDGGFTYNLNANYTRADRAIEEFLGGNREGFCTQFATSMALLSRELGVPSRVVYGATTGKEKEPDEYVVTGSNIHTWVEVYFPGVGWYTFDPTPGFSVPSTMEANAPRPELPDDLSRVSPEAQALKGEQPSEPVPQPQETPPNNSTSSAEDSARARYTYALSTILLLFILIVAVPLTKKVLAARGRPEDLYRDLTGRLRDILPLAGGAGVRAGGAIAGSPALTPTERLLLLAGAVGIEDAPFREFARVYSESLYAADTRSGSRREAARVYRRALQEFAELPWWKRVLAAVNPASLLLRARRRLAAYKGRLAKALHSRIRGLKALRRKS